MRPGAEDDVREALEHAATILDVGRSVDYYRRWEHAADIVVSADLYGFTHRSIALMAALILRAGNRRPSIEPYSTLVDARERRNVSRAAVLLALADEVERRIPKGKPVSVESQTGRNGVILAVPVPHDWEPAEIASRFQRVFGRELLIEPTNGTHIRAPLSLR
jgi:exopolyphosphatase/pppGpp-phosphohydrolase